MSENPTNLPGQGKYAMDYSRTVVIGDLHGDLQAFCSSLSDKGLLKYDGVLEPVIEKILSHSGTGLCKALEAMVVKQKKTTRLIFLGDILDRWEQGYHILRFLGSVNWASKNIEPVYVIGNHDLHNFHFFINPFLAHEIYAESDHSISARVAYICQMGLPESLAGFKKLHGAEIIEIQRRFFMTGRLDWDTGHGLFTLQYDKDYTPMLYYKGNTWEDAVLFCFELARHYGIVLDPKSDEPLTDFARKLGEYEKPDGPHNWFFLNPPALRVEDDWREGYDPSMLYYNVFYEGIGENEIRNLMFVDWRVISLVWRKYYGNFYRNFRQMHLEGETLFVHGGISPRAMVDSHVFGVLFHIFRRDFASCKERWGLDAKRVVSRANRLAAQVMENALNDFSFHRMNGSEILDIIGSCRGGDNGFTQFGGTIWADYNYLQMAMQRPEVLNLYERFMNATGIHRIICGHTRFEDPDDPGTRYLQIRELAEIGMEYICVDNSCSRGYRGASGLNGIEINEDGEILDTGKFSVW